MGTGLRRLLPVLGALAAMACSTAGPPAAPAAAVRGGSERAPADEEWRRYFAAVADARVRERSEISKDLLPILPGTGGLVWQDGRVLMVTWTRAAHFDGPAYVKGHRLSLFGATWLTAFPVVRDFCTSYAGADLAGRLRELIGLPPDNLHDAFLEIWVRPRDLFRPCPDPEITDSECQLEIPLLESPPPPAAGEPPWHCPPPGAAPFQEQGQFVVVQQSHLDWMCRNWRASFTNEDPEDDYPWTALGYTYDWGNPSDPEGPSEFVAVAGASVVFERLVPTAAYCGR